MALLLAIETSASRGDVALLRHGEVVGTRALTLPRRHNEELLAQVQSLLAAAGAAPGELAAVAYGSGPGSFTGVRLAAAAALALAWASDLPAFAVGSAEALARKAWRQSARAPGSGMEVLVALDARVNQLYLTHVDVDGTGVPRAAATQLLAWSQLDARAATPGFAAIGDAWADPRMPAALAGAARTLDADGQPEATDVGALAWQRWCAGERPPAGTELPAYLRGADAWG
jgi:tRNA threonylcarbamoyladenosine biosynthesis protein TsaB